VLISPEHTPTGTLAVSLITRYLDLGRAREVGRREASAGKREKNGNGGVRKERTKGEKVLEENARRRR